MVGETPEDTLPLEMRAHPSEVEPIEAFAIARRESPRRGCAFECLRKKAMSTLDDDQRASWSLLLRGVAGLLFGFLALAWLGAPAAPRALLFGGYALVDGLATASFAMDVRRHDTGSTLYFIRAAVGVAAGLSMLFFPGAVLGMFRILVGIWAVSVGSAEIVLAARLRHEGQRATLSVATGMFALLGGVGLLVASSLSAYSVGGTFAYLALLSGAASTSVATRWQEHVVQA